MLLARQMKVKLESITFDIEGDYGMRPFNFYLFLSLFFHMG
jgi:hypothetical protein